MKVTYRIWDKEEENWALKHVCVMPHGAIVGIFNEHWRYLDSDRYEVREINVHRSE